MSKQIDSAYDFDPSTGEILIAQHPASAALAALEEVHARAEIAKMNMTAKSRAITEHVRHELDAVKAEYDSLMEVINADMELRKEEVKHMVVASGVSLNGQVLSAIFVNGRVSWDERKVLEYASKHPEVMEFRKTGEPSVTIRAKAGK